MERLSQGGHRFATIAGFLCEKGYLRLFLDAKRATFTQAARIGLGAGGASGGTAGRRNESYRLKERRRMNKQLIAKFKAHMRAQEPTPVNRGKRNAKRKAQKLARRKNRAG